MRTRSGRHNFGDIEARRLDMLRNQERQRNFEERERERVYNAFLEWKRDINTTFSCRTSIHLDDIHDLPYYDYFTMGISKDIVLEMAMSNMI